MPTMRRSLPLLLLCFAVLAEPAAALAHSPEISIIIDDVGNNHAEGRQAVDLPGPVACAFLPDTPFAADLARSAYANGKEVMLHLPLESVDNRPLGPGGITLNDTEHEFRQTVESDLKAIPHVMGVNNHMGSLMTRHPGAMSWLMSELQRHRKLFFVDSFTTAKSVALEAADAHALPTIRRDVFLDDVRKPAAIREQLARLIAIAKVRGYALAIGHPYPETLAVLQEDLPAFAAMGIKLVPVRRLIQRREAARQVNQPVNAAREVPHDQAGSSTGTTG